jgi:hypothetical protein
LESVKKALNIVDDQIVGKSYLELFRDKAKSIDSGLEDDFTSDCSV